MPEQKRKRYAQGMYPRNTMMSPFEGEYIPVYDPATQNMMMQALTETQQRHDTVQGAISEQIAQIGAMEVLDPHLIQEEIGNFKERIDNIAKDYNFNYSQAKNKLTREIAKEASNPVYHFAREHVRQARIAQETQLRLGPRAMILNDPRNPDALRRALETGDMSALEANVMQRDPYGEIIDELGTRITPEQKQILLRKYKNNPEIQGFLESGMRTHLNEEMRRELARDLVPLFKDLAPSIYYEGQVEGGIDPNYAWTQDDEAIAERMAQAWSYKDIDQTEMRWQQNPSAQMSQDKGIRLEDNIFFDTFTGVGESATDRGLRRINRDWDNLRSQASLVRAPGTQSSALDQSVNKAQQLVGDVLGVSEEELTSNLNQIQRDLRRGRGSGYLLVNRLFGTRERDNSLLQNDPEQLNELMGLVHNYLTLKYPEYAETGKLPITGWRDLPTPIEMSDDGSLTVPRGAQSSFASYLTEVLTERELLKADKSYEDMFKDQPLIQQEVFNGNMTLDEAVNFGQANELAQYMTFSTSTDIPDPNARDRLTRAVRTSYMGASNIKGKAFILSPNRKGDLEESELTGTRVAGLLGEKDREIFNITVTPYDSRGNTTLNFHTNVNGTEEIIRVPGEAGSNETRVLLQSLNSVMEGLYGHKTDTTTIELPDQRRVLINKQFVRQPYETEQGLQVPGYYDTKLSIEVPYLYPDGTIEMRPEPIQPSEITEELVKAIMLRSGQRVQQQPTNY